MRMQILMRAHVKSQTFRNVQSDLHNYNRVMFDLFWHVIFTSRSSVIRVCFDLHRSAFICFHCFLPVRAQWLRTRAAQLKRDNLFSWREWTGGLIRFWKARRNWKKPTATFSSRTRSWRTNLPSMNELLRANEPQKPENPVWKSLTI